MNKVLLVAATAAISMSSLVVQASGKDMYNNLGCAGCHGVGGKSVVPTYPSLSGQQDAYTVKQLKDFQSGVRKDATMNAMAPMAAGHEKDIAEYLAAQ